MANTTFLPLLLSKTDCTLRYALCDFLLYEGSTPFTPRCMAVAKPRCLYSCASSTNNASTPISSKFSTSSTERIRASLAFTSAFSLATASFFRSRACIPCSSIAATPAISTSISLSSLTINSLEPLEPLLARVSSTCNFSSILSLM